MKNIKTITAVVIFAVTFIFSAGLVRLIIPAPVVQYVYLERPVERSSNAIETFLLRDIQNGTTRMDDSDTADYAEAVMNYWETSSSMNDSAFPSDFQDAWHNHMQAWHNYAEYLAKVKKSSARRDSRESSRLNYEINRTWEDVKVVGRNYGSQLR